MTAPKQEAAVKGSILWEFYKLSKSSESDRALCELFIGAFFFAMHSCKYVKVPGLRKTNNKSLHLSDCVSNTFEHQKRDTKHETITQHKSGDKILCSIKIWAFIIKSITSYASATTNTTVNTYMLSNNRLHIFSGPELLKKLRFTTTSIVQDTLGFQPTKLFSFCL
jgi:hypothetical protein